MDNLLENWSFECGTAPWTTLGGGATLVASTAHAHSGMYSALTTNRTQLYQGPLQYLMTLTAGNSYAASSWVYVPSPGTVDGSALHVNMTAEVLCRDTNGAVQPTQYIQIASTPINTDLWFNVTGTFAMPSPCNILEAGIYIDGPEPGVDMYVDDVTLR